MYGVKRWYVGIEAKTSNGWVGIEYANNCFDIVCSNQDNRMGGISRFISFESFKDRYTGPDLTDFWVVDKSLCTAERFHRRITWLGATGIDKHNLWMEAVGRGITMYVPDYYHGIQGECVVLPGRSVLVRASFRELNSSAYDWRASYSDVAFTGEQIKDIEEWLNG